MKLETKENGLHTLRDITQAFLGTVNLIYIQRKPWQVL